MAKLYLDSSVIVKRYIAERGSESVAEIYRRSDTKEIGICFSIWNIGETIGVIDQYQRRGWITEGQFAGAIGGLAGETLRLIRIEALELLPVSSSELSETWDLIRRYHLSQGDAVQIIACKSSTADKLISADKLLLEVAEKEGIPSVNVEDRHAMKEL
jgi:predicted nucleic acid-binding protein